MPGTFFPKHPHKQIQKEKEFIFDIDLVFVPDMQSGIDGESGRLESKINK